MDLKTLRALPSISKRRAAKRIGRGPGSGTGKTAGRGHKGAGQRSGFKRRAFFEGGQTPFYRRFPKRGFSNAPFRKVYAVINLSDLNRFEDGAAVNRESLHAVGLVKQAGDGVKILGGGELERKNLKVEVERVSKSAASSIAENGGSVTELHTPNRPKRPRVDWAGLARQQKAQQKAEKEAGDGTKAKAKAKVKAKPKTKKS